MISILVRNLLECQLSWRGGHRILACDGVLSVGNAPTRAFVGTPVVESHRCNTLDGCFELIVSTTRDGLVGQRHFDIRPDSLSFQAISLPRHISPDWQDQEISI